MRIDKKLASLIVPILCVIAVPSRGLAVEIDYRLYSVSATMGPQAEAFSAKLQDISGTVLGTENQVSFKSLGVAAIPSQFANILAAVKAGTVQGGFDAAYISGGDLNKVWGFIYNSGVPFGPTYDEYLGFLLGKNDAGQTGVDLMQSILEKNGKNVVAIPIVSSSEQVSGFFPLPVGHVKWRLGIGFTGLCQQNWTMRFLPPAENVLGLVCDKFVAARIIPAKNIKFISAIPGSGSLIDAVKSGVIQAFEFATPLDDVSQLFVTKDNPGTLGLRYMHTPGWHQQFLITYMIINKGVWNGLSAGQQALIRSVSRDHLVSSYAQSMRQQGAALRFIQDVNNGDYDLRNDITLVKWPDLDLALLREATIDYLNARANDSSLNATDRQDYAVILEALRQFVQSNHQYWDVREVSPKMRFEDWKNAAGEPWVNR